MSDTDRRLRLVAEEDARQFSPSAARNCVPIREVLTRVLPKKGIVLEIGSPELLSTALTLNVAPALSHVRRMLAPHNTNLIRVSWSRAT
jgi:hypothetical protein